MKKGRISTFKSQKRRSTAMTIFFVLLSLVYLYPIAVVLINSFKSNAAVNTETFALPNSETFMGFGNYIKGMTFGNYPFLKSVMYSLVITLSSVALILVCTSMAASLRVLDDSALPDGHVHAFQDRRHAQAQHPLDDTRCLSRLRRGTCGVYVLRLCQGDTNRD